MAKVRIRLTLSPETAGRLEGMRVQFGDVAGAVVGVDDNGDGTYSVLVEPFDWKDRAGWNVQLGLNDRMRALATPTLMALAQVQAQAPPPLPGSDTAWGRLVLGARLSLGAA